MIAEILAIGCLGIWCYLLLARGFFWILREAEVLPAASPGGLASARVAVIVPARNEALVVGLAVHSLLTQDYPGPLHLFLVDDESSDDTVAVAQRSAERLGKPDQLTIIKAGPRPSGWTGKLWAVQQGLVRARDFGAEYYLLTDADILHHNTALTQLTRRAQSGPYDLVSLMVELKCRALAEQLLIPAFVFFFFMLYPPRWVGDVKRRTAAAAGGCILVRSQALDNMGGIAPIRGEWIDDCALARAIKRSGGKLWLGSTRNSSSLRGYSSWSEIGQMISRSAFTQLRHSILLLILTVAGMLITFVLPCLLLLFGAYTSILAISSWILMSLAYLPTLRFYRRSPALAPLLPFIAIFYLGATIHSAVQHWRGKGGLWKGRVQGLQN